MIDGRKWQSGHCKFLVYPSALAQIQRRQIISWRSAVFGLVVFLVFATLAGTVNGARARLRPPTQSPYVINNKKYYPIPTARGFREKGIASWYGPTFHGRKTSNGEVYNMYSMTAAHKILPMNTMLLVRNMENGREIVVRVNDRGPFIRGRVIDLSYSAAHKLGVVANGTARVELIALAEGRTRPGYASPQLSYQDLTHGEFYVQIGAFAQKINALKLQKRFTDAGHTTVIQKHYGTTNPIYRVQVYAGRTLNNARRAEKALLEHGYVGAFIIAR